MFCRIIFIRNSKKKYYEVYFFFRKFRLLVSLHVDSLITFKWNSIYDNIMRSLSYRWDPNNGGQIMNLHNSNCVASPTIKSRCNELFARDVSNSYVLFSVMGTVIRFGLIVSPLVDYLARANAWPPVNCGRDTRWPPLFAQKSGSVTLYFAIREITASIFISFHRIEFLPVKFN